MIPLFSAFALQDFSPSTKRPAFKKDRKVFYLRFRMDPPDETKNNEDYEFELNLKFADHRLASLVAPWQLKTRIELLL